MEAKFGTLLREFHRDSQPVRAQYSKCAPCISERVEAGVGRELEAGTQEEIEGEELGPQGRLGSREWSEKQSVGRRTHTGDLARRCAGGVASVDAYPDEGRQEPEAERPLSAGADAV